MLFWRDFFELFDFFDPFEHQTAPVADAASVDGHRRWQRLPRGPDLDRYGATSLNSLTSLIPLNSLILGSSSL